MAHYVIVQFSNKQQVFFYGYANGVIYDHFKAQHCNGHVSGTNEGVYRATDDFLNMLENIKQDTRCLEYPDEKRFLNFFQDIANNLKDHDSSCPVYIHFA